MRSREPHIIIKPSRGIPQLGLKELYDYRGLMFFLAWRDLKVRYKQTVLGVLWVVLQPILLVAVFSLIFGKLAKLPSDGIPYPLFALSGLVPWLFFSVGLTQSANSLIADARLVSKIYFPRLVVPIAAIVGTLVDFLIGLVLLIGLLVFYGYGIGVNTLYLPLFAIFTGLASLSVGVWMAALNVKYRDFRYVIPFVVQVGLFATPVIYPSSLIPERFQWAYGLNPMAGIVEGFRWSLVGEGHFSHELVYISAGIVLFLLVSGIYYFRSVERTLADHI